ncbi:MAG: aminotransferase class I/II-fold pyridoxal phosphate-dependent enzyme [Thermodesulfobacteriota bacterium]
MIGPHGGDILATARRLGCRVDELVDLSSNLSPLGPPPDLLLHLAGHLPQIACLPETGSETLQAAFAQAHGLPAEAVLVGSGTTEFIFALPAALGRGRTLVIGPTYSDYALASEWAGRQVRHWLLSSAEDFRFRPEQLLEDLAPGDLVALCNPNNPTGGLVASRELRQLAAAAPRSLFLVDETYRPFCTGDSLLSEALPANLLVLASFSKIYSIPGLRLGFLAGAPDLLQRLESQRRPWGVNRLAQLAGLYLLAHGRAQEEAVRAYLAQARPALVAGLAGLPGVRPLPGRAHFVLCWLAAGQSAAWLRTMLLERRVMIRDCSSFVGLDDRYFRVSAGPPAANQALLAALAGVLAEAA